MITKKDRKFYNLNGYLIKKKFVNKFQQSELFKTFSKILIKNKIINPKKKINWKSDELNKKLILLRRKKPKIFSKIYDTIQKTIAIKKILIDSNLTKLASSILNEKENTICEINTILRMDPPNDTKNSLGWHQDGSLNKNTYNQSCVIWMPLINVNKKNGAIDLLLKSHKKIGPTRGHYPSNIEKKFQIFKAELNNGDVLIINNRTIHRSGSNQSDKLRFTLRSRFNKLP